MPSIHDLIVDEAHSGQRLDVWLTGALTHLSRSRIRNLIDGGQVTVAGQPARASVRLRAGQTVRLSEPDPVAAEPQAEDIPLAILFEDPFLLVLDKPAGIAVHPGAGRSSGTLVNALLHHVGDLSAIGGVLRPGIVHRLDRGTSGLLVVAKDDATHRALSQQFSSRRVEKEYLAVVLGTPARQGATIDSPIGRDPVHRQRMSTRAARARTAHTEYVVVERFPGAALLRVRIRTGRTHQIRVHLASIGHPVLGDTLYLRHPLPPALHAQESVRRLGRNALHATRLAFVHPATDEALDFESPWPADLVELLAALRSPA
jgi:23S rRNA pseudouridine1911/1915/1917 synthase